MKKKLTAKLFTIFSFATLFTLFSCSSYLIYSEKEAKFGKNNIIEGDVGVKSIKGKAEFDKNTILNPFAVKAAKVEAHQTAMVNNITLEIADDGYENTFYPYNGNTTGVSDITIQENETVNLFQTEFKKITIKKGANVTFLGNVINIVELVTEDATLDAPTIINIDLADKVKIKKKVVIGKFNLINKNDNLESNVTFYCGDEDNDNEKFTIKGDSVYFRANIMVPHGKLSVKGGGPFYTEIVGWFEGEKVETGDRVIWRDPYNEAQNRKKSKSQKSKQQKAEVQNLKTTNLITKVISVFPNPSVAAFTFQINDPNLDNQTIQIKIFDTQGKLMEAISNTTTSKSNTFKAGATLIAGTYFAEVIYGENKKILKLIKK